MYLVLDDMVAGYERAKIKREELTEVERRFLRDERFIYPLNVNTKLLPEERKAGSELVSNWFFWFGEHLEDFHREAVEGTAKGEFIGC